MQKLNPIVVIEDNQADFDFLVIALNNYDLHERVLHLPTSADALKYLESAGQPSFIAPELVLVDLKLDGPDGIEIIEKAKSLKAFSKVPMIVLSNSSDPKDINASFLAGASAYLTKPMSLREFEVLVEKIVRQYINSPGLNILLM